MANRRKGILFKIISYKGKNLYILKRSIEKGILEIKILPLNKSKELCRFYVLRKGKRDYCLKRAKYQILIHKGLTKTQVWYETVLCSYHKELLKKAKKRN
jgi:hypothetical protein